MEGLQYRGQGWINRFRRISPRRWLPLYGCQELRPGSRFRDDGTNADATEEFVCFAKDDTKLVVALSAWWLLKYSPIKIVERARTVVHASYHRAASVVIRRNGSQPSRYGTLASTTYSFIEQQHICDGEDDIL